jgi:transposase
MLSLSPRVRIYLARGVTDMRKAIDGLEAVTRLLLKHDAFSGDLFVFCNRRRNRIKILYWESSGFWLLHKRLEKGTFAWPATEELKQTHIEMQHSELTALLGGLDFRDAKKRKWYRRKGVNRPPSATD